MAEQSVDKFLNSIRKRQKFLLGRMVIMILLLLLTIMPLFWSGEAETLVIINSVLILATPILIDYIWGFSTYTLGTNITRSVGIVFSLIVVGTCLSSYIFPVFGEFIFNLPFVGYVMWIFPVIAFFDLVFSCSKNEIHFYDVTDQLDKDLLNKLNKVKAKEEYYDEKVEKMKQKLLEEIG
jgi:ABC-type multidrug transport system fused ATPase/permease subunit